MSHIQQFLTKAGITSLGKAQIFQHIMRIACNKVFSNGFTVAIFALLICYEA